MASARPFGSAPESCASALAIKREAARRYLEFAELVDEHGDWETAALFREMARFEEERAAALAAHAARLAIPEAEAWRYSWIDDAPSEKVSRELVYHLMTPHDALAIALGAEKRALAFFEALRAKAQDAGLRRLAGDIAEEEGRRIARLEEAMRCVPRPFHYGEDYEAFVMR
ncbi:MAG: hypothetical protein OHK0026_07940 [Rhodocyclaceae bacterium]